LAWVILAAAAYKDVRSDVSPALDVARDRLAALVEDPRGVEDTSTIALAALALGPENTRHLGRIVLANDPVAADFVCTRLMGLNPLRVSYMPRRPSFSATDRLSASCIWEKSCHPLCSPSRCCPNLLTCAFRFGCSIFRGSLPPFFD
jgi:hypothetical protein